jgi:hypothetical protein
MDRYDTVKRVHGRGDGAISAMDHHVRHRGHVEAADRVGSHTTTVDHDVVSEDTAKQFAVLGVDTPLLARLSELDPLDRLQLDNRIHTASSHCLLLVA